MANQHPSRITWPAIIAAVLAAGAYFLSNTGGSKLPALPALGAKTNEASTSGISSGAYMAGQFQLAYSNSVAGAAIIAGGPWGCAESVYADVMPGPGAVFLNLSRAINGCMLNALMIYGIPNTRSLVGKAERLAEQGRIDPVASVRDDRVYLFSGTEDHTVVPPIVRTAVEFYEAMGIPKNAIKHVETMPAGHAFITENEGLACDRTGKPFVVDCDYDQAGDLLAHIYGKLEPRAAQPAGTYTVFDQTPFTRDFSNHGMSDEGVVYVPRTCAAAGGCRVHIAFHGCAQNRATVGEAFVTQTGFARWADTNRLIVLFPQTTEMPTNPQGCWDWWGYTGHDYLTKDAPQITAVKRMLDRLAELAAPS